MYSKYKKKPSRQTFGICDYTYIKVNINDTRGVYYVCILIIVIPILCRTDYTKYYEIISDK